MNLMFLTFIPLNSVGEPSINKDQAITWLERLWEKLFVLSLIKDQRDDQPEAKRHLRADVLDGSQDVLVRDQRPPGGAPVRRLDQRGELVEERSRRKVVETDHIFHLRGKEVMGQWDMSQYTLSA